MLSMPMGEQDIWDWSYLFFFFFYFYNPGDRTSKSWVWQIPPGTVLLFGDKFECGDTRLSHVSSFLNLHMEQHIKIDFFPIRVASCYSELNVTSSHHLNLPHPWLLYIIAFIPSTSCEYNRLCNSNKRHRELSFIFNLAWQTAPFKEKSTSTHNRLKAHTSTEFLFIYFFLLNYCRGSVRGCIFSGCAIPCNSVIL